MPGQFTDTGSRYALEALTGRQALNLAANAYTISSALTNGLDINRAASATGLTRSGFQTITLSPNANQFVPGAAFILVGNATAAANGLFTVENVNYTTNQISYSYSGTAPTASGTVYVLPQAKTTYIALCTAQPLDNNFLTSGAPGTLQIQEYAATGYSRQSITWGSATGPNSGTSTVFVGTGANVNGTSTIAPTFTPGPTVNLTVTNIVINGSTANPPNVATVTTSANQGVAVGDNITIGGAWTGGTGALNAGTYTVTSVPSSTTFTFGTNQTSIIGNATSPTANGTFTGGTLLLNGPYNVTFTTYNTVVGTGTPVVANHGLVVGSTVNVTGTWVSAGVLDQVNATIVAVPTTSTFTVASQLTGTGAATNTTQGSFTNGVQVSITASGTTVFPGSYFTNGTTAIPATGFVTYLATNNFKAGDTVIVSGATTVTGYNRTTQVFAANSSAFVVFDTTTGAPTGTISIARVGAVSVGGLIQGPASGSLTFGAFTANTGATITHAALVSSPSANSAIAVSGITVGSGAATTTTLGSNYALIRTTTAHGLKAGHQVYLNGLTPLTWNGLYTVESLDSNGTPTTGFWIANTTASTNTTAGTVAGVQNGELLAWWVLDTPRTPAINDQVTIGTNQLSLYVN